MIGLTLMVPWPPLPAGTLLGATGVPTVMVNCGDTASTVRFCGCEIVVLGEVPVTVMVYSPGVTGTSFTGPVVIVAVAPAEGFTDWGLIVQTGAVAPVLFDVTTQPRFTVPVKPLSAETAMFAAESCPGSTAKGLKGATVIVKSWPNAEGSRVRNAATTQKSGVLTRIWDFSLDFNDSDLNMSGFRFN